MESNEITTVPNQKILYVHREKVDKDFIQISKKNFSAAYKQMSQCSAALALYIWLVGNKDGYHMAFSPQAIHNTLGMPLTSCRDALKKLQALGYLIPRGEKSNVYDFYEVTQTPPPEKSEDDDFPPVVKPKAERSEVPKPKPGEFHF